MKFQSLIRAKGNSDEAHLIGEMLELISFNPSFGLKAIPTIKQES